MEFSSPDQFLGLLALASFALALGLWLSARWSNRRDAERQRRLALAVEDERDDPADDLMGVADAVAEIRTDCTCPWNNGYARPGTSLTHATWCPAYDVHAAARTAGMAGHYTAEPQPTLGQERLYDAEGLVQYGLELVDRRCLDARRDFATDRICPACAKVFGTVTA